VKNDTEAYAAFDSSKLRHAVAIAVGKRPTLVVTAIAREPSGLRLGAQARAHADRRTHHVIIQTH
jgi:hypothetical protein